MIIEVYLPDDEQIEQWIKEEHIPEGKSLNRIAGINHFMNNPYMILSEVQDYIREQIKYNRQAKHYEETHKENSNEKN